jgi:hypothetical protein
LGIYPVILIEPGSKYNESRHSGPDPESSQI